MLAESVDYDAIQHQRVPVIAEAMDILNAPQQVNESQQDFERRWNAVPKAQVQAAHTAAKNSDVESNAEENQEELVDDEEVPPEVEEPEGDDDAESIHIDGDEYITVDVYDNEYYACDNKKEHLFALTEHQGDKHVCM
ncbi:hypothetical protein C0995_015510 [Termitomyces sp. Mi166|nr:hypothetical protein C0995_015510 [Termitomyces sp. Mi166\